VVEERERECLPVEREADRTTQPDVGKERPRGVEHEPVDPGQRLAEVALPARARRRAAGAVGMLEWPAERQRPVAARKDTEVAGVGQRDRLRRLDVVRIDDALGTAAPRAG